jgi:hypothetical protein
VISRRDSSDSDDGGSEMGMPFGIGGMPFRGGGGKGSSGGFMTPSFSVPAGLPTGARYTGQVYSSTGSANGRPLIEGPRGGTFYFTPSGNKRYV